MPPAVWVDEAVVAGSILSLESAGESTAGDAFDFVVLADGGTAVSGWNDGFSMGSYGLVSGIYADLIMARWSELTHDRD